MPRPRILVVDDNTNVLEILKEFLGVAYVVDTAPSAVDALAAMARHTPSAILLDVNMPGTDGLTFLASLRQRGVDIPVFVITGYDSPTASHQARQSGATQYLVKPVDLRHLDRLIADALHTPMITA